MWGGRCRCGFRRDTGLNPRASVKQLPEGKGRRSNDCIQSSPAQAGACTSKALPFRAGYGATMKLFTEAFLDKWEAHATKRGKRWETETPERWYLVISPDLLLQPTENYSLRLYIRQPAFHVWPILAINVALLASLVYFWFMDPAIFQSRHLHKALIGMLSDGGYYSIAWLSLLWVALIYLLYLPRFCFWNRRAERLRREPPLLSMEAERVAIDAGTWPPPPILTRD